jgi:hypothetical protein
MMALFGKIGYHHLFIRQPAAIEADQASSSLNQMREAYRVNRRMLL